MAKRFPARAIFLICLGFSAVAAGIGRQARTNQQGVFRAGTTQILVDVIVTDKDGQFMTGLTADDFEVYEDGKLQKLLSVTLVGSVAAGEGPGPSEAEAGPGGEADEPVPDLRFSALVFDKHSIRAENLPAVTQSALAFVDTLGPGDRVAVLGNDSRLFLLEGFTNDPERLRSAIRAAVEGNSSRYPSSQDTVAQILETAAATPEKMMNEPGEALERGWALAAGAGSLPGGITSDDILMQIFLRFEQIEQEIQAEASISSLLSVVEGLKLLPGRKSAVFVSEGFQISNTKSAKFTSMVSAANRANVAVYTLDAGGLRPNTVYQEARRRPAVTNPRNPLTDPTRVVGGESALGRTERLARGDPGDTLARLARSTGGLAIRNTNDLLSGLKRIRQDMSVYYLLSYAPAAAADGTFRRIEVKVRRPGLQVRAREGYLALEDAGGTLMLDYEQPLYRMAFDSSVGNRLRMVTSAFQFPESDGGRMVRLVATVPAEAVEFRREASGRRTGDLGVLALIRDWNGTLVAKASRRLLPAYSAREWESAANQRLLLDLSRPLVEGAYRIDVIVRDALSGGASRLTTNLRVPKAGTDSLLVSSLVPVAGFQTEASGSQDDPLRYGNVVVVPKLDGVFSKLVDDEVRLFFTVRAEPAAFVTVRVQILQNGLLMEELPARLPSPDPDGIIRSVARFPLSPATPEGKYDVRLRVREGDTEKVSETSILIRE